MLSSGIFGAAFFFAEWRASARDGFALFRACAKLRAAGRQNHPLI
jgi:hypothetical protein